MDADEVLGFRIPGKLLVTLPLALVASCSLVAILSMIISDETLYYPWHNVHSPRPLSDALGWSTLLLPCLTGIALAWRGPRPRGRRGRLFLGAIVAWWIAWISACRMDYSWGCIGFPSTDQLYLCNATDEEVIYYPDPAGPGYPAGTQVGGYLAARRALVLLARPSPGRSLRIEAVSAEAARRTSTRPLIFCQQYTTDDLVRVKGRIDIVAGAVSC
jgi:hypothetical protein